jgi:lipoprotein-anchoring transpeptidase ErfK/SrfK
MIRFGCCLPGLVALCAPVFASAQQPRSANDSVAVEQESAAPPSHWEVNVVREVPLVEDAGSTARGAPPARRWVVNVVHDVPFLSKSESARAEAERATGFRVVVDIGDHRLYAIDGSDTLRTVPVATASNATLTFEGRTWRFRTPLGARTVLAKEKDPVWTPPVWHYAEVASEYGLKLRQLVRGQTVLLHDGTRLMTKGNEVGVIYPGESEFMPMALDSHIVFDSTLFIPPVGTRHRSIQGELGHYRLKLGNGYQLHGTPYAKSIGSSVTHGCVRMGDDDIAWLYAHVPVGTTVYLY